MSACLTCVWIAVVFHKFTALQKRSSDLSIISYKLSLPVSLIDLIDVGNRSLSSRSGFSEYRLIEYRFNFLDLGVLDCRLDAGNLWKLGGKKLLEVYWKSVTLLEFCNLWKSVGKIVFYWKSACWNFHFDCIFLLLEFCCWKTKKLCWKTVVNIFF